MKVIITFTEDNFSKLYYKLLKLSQEHRENVQPSRAGTVIDMGPAVIELTSRDTFRMPLLHKRHFNPFFALAEFSWFIEGSNLLQPLQYFISHYNKFSDDGVTLNGAYGHRLRHGGIDQIAGAIEILKHDPACRRVVLNMYNVQDLGSSSKDVPCNTAIMLKIRDNALDMTVINRSNDLFWGVPYNVFMFYMFQCYLANRLEINVGFQRHYTDSLHLYTDKLSRVDEIVSANTEQGIDDMHQSVSTFNIAEYLNVDHRLVVEQRFSELSHSEFKDLFNLYLKSEHQNSLKDIVNNLPKNQLGYVVYQWLLMKSKFNDAEEVQFSTCS